MDQITQEQRQQIERKRLEALRRKNNVLENKENIPTSTTQTKAQLINSLTNAIPASQRSLPSNPIVFLQQQ
jgi:hypothetical protein